MFIVYLVLCILRLDFKSVAAAAGIIYEIYETIIMPDCYRQFCGRASGVSVRRQSNKRPTCTYRTASSELHSKLRKILNDNNCIHQA